MINRLVNKYASVASKYALGTEDLKQICAITLWKTSRMDKPLEIPLEAYIYKSMEFSIRKEVEKLRKKDMNCISLQLLASRDNDNATALEDTLVDDNVDVEADVIDREMYAFYETEIKRVLPKDKADALINKYFRGYFGVSRYKLWAARHELLKRSYIFKEEYFKLKGIKVDFSLYD